VHVCIFVFTFLLLCARDPTLSVNGLLVRRESGSLQLQRAQDENDQYASRKHLRHHQQQLHHQPLHQHHAQPARLWLTLCCREFELRVRMLNLERSAYFGNSCARPPRLLPFFS
jgi:hypothetical protein